MPDVLGVGTTMLEFPVTFELPIKVEKNFVGGFIATCEKLPGLLVHADDLEQVRFQLGEKIPVAIAMIVNEHTPNRTNPPSRR